MISMTNILVLCALPFSSVVACSYVLVTLLIYVFPVSPSKPPEGKEF